MKSSEIRAQLQSLINIVPALTAAGDIVAQAEAAEAQLKNYPKQMAAAETQMQEAQSRLDELNASLLKAKSDYSNQINSLEASKMKAKQSAVEANQELTVLTDRLNKLHVELTRLRDEGQKEVDEEIRLYRESKASLIAEIDAQVAEKEKQLDKAEKAYESFKKRAGL